MDDSYIKRLYRLYPDRPEKKINGNITKKLSIGSARDNFLDVIFNKDDSIAGSEQVLIKIKANWKTLAGEAGNYSRPVELRAEQLVVQVDKSVFAQELSMTAPVILEKIYKLTGVRLKKIRIDALKRS